jgi:EamA domain-containing membrane protein RarD
MKQFKRMILYSVIAYVISFVLGSIVAVLSGFDVASTDTIPTSLWLWSIVLTLIVVAGVTHYYFKKEKPSATMGFYFGLSLVVIGSVLDMLVLFIFARTVDMTIGESLSYYANPLFLATIVMLLLTTTLIGLWCANKRSKK